MNRAERRKAQRKIRKAIKTGVGVNVQLAGYRVVRSDGTVKAAAGIAPLTRRTQGDNRDSE